LVADLDDPDKVLAVLPGGVSGRLFDKHGKDQIEPFINGSKVYWWFSDAAIKAHSRNTLVLKPQVGKPVSNERRLWPRASRLIGKETFGARFRNWPLLGFAIRNNTGKM